MTLKKVHQQVRSQTDRATTAMSTPQSERGKKLLQVRRDQILVETFQPRCCIHAIADRRILHALHAAQASRNDKACHMYDSHAEKLPTLGGHLHVRRNHLLLH